MELTFSGDVIETIGFQRDAERQRENLRVVEGLLTAHDRLRDPTPQRHPTWRGIDGDAVAAMLDTFITVDRATKARGRLLAAYIRSRLTAVELGDWTVVLINNRQAPEPPVTIAGLDIGLTTRAYYKSRDDKLELPEDGDFTIRRLGDQGTETLDLDADELALAEAMRTDTERRAIEFATAQGADLSRLKPPAIGPFVRRVRPVTRGLLVVYALNPVRANMPERVTTIPGLLVSFPHSPDAPTISYVVPRRYWEREAA
jgi:hypothetical protein